MLAWHLAGSLFLFRWVFRDPAVDVRFLLVGAVLPDLGDMTVGTLVAADRFSSGELWLHTLLAPTLVVVVLLILTRRGVRRRGWMAMAVGMFFHLLLDGMWTSSQVFLWPLFGLDFPAGPDPYWAGAWERAVNDPLRWVQEAVGAAYLATLWHRARRADPGFPGSLLLTGRLPESDGGVTSVT